MQFWQQTNGPVGNGEDSGRRSNGEDCVDDNSAIKSATRLVDSHDVELWQMDRPVARFDGRSKQLFNK
jgi:hypothetical protein